MPLQAFLDECGLGQFRESFASCATVGDLCGGDWSDATLAGLGLSGAEVAALRKAVKEHLVAVACEGSTAPSGEVTLCFTDIQGSTRLWECFGARFKPVLDLHHRIMRSAILKHWGYEVT